MKRNFATAVVALASLFFVGATVAEAVDVKFGGQLRPRFEVGDHGMTSGSTGATTAGFDQRQDAQKIFSTRARLSADASINDQTSAFIQLQSVGVWGAAANINGSGSRNAFVANDNNVDVGLHQAYFALKNFFTLPVDLKVGRQEIVLDGHRLLGNTDWTQGAQAHDAIVLAHSEGDHTIVYGFSKALTASTVSTGDLGSRHDINVHVLWGNLKNLLHANSGLSLYFVAVEDGCSPTTAQTACNNTVATTATGGTRNDNNIYTFGFRQAGNLAQIWGIDYRAEFYYQTGKAFGDSAVANASLGYGSAVVNNGVDRGAYMFGVRVGKTFNDVMWKPGVTVWYDQLQGTDDGDVRDKKFRTFNTLFDTGHKFYGYMDLFLPANGANTAFLGLRDFAGKFSVKPLDKTSVNADIHAFWTETNVNDNATIRTNLGIPANSAADSNHLGEELDLTIVHNYNPNTNITLGYSHFWADDLFYAVNGKATGVGLNASGAKGVNARDSSWGYVMFDVKF